MVMPIAEIDGGRGTTAGGDPGREFATYRMAARGEHPEPGTRIKVLIDGSVRSATVVGIQPHLFGPYVSVRVAL